MKHSFNAAGMTAPGRGMPLGDRERRGCGSAQTSIACRNPARRWIARKAALHPDHAGAIGQQSSAITLAARWHRN